MADESRPDIERGGDPVSGGGAGGSKGSRESGGNDGLIDRLLDGEAEEVDVTQVRGDRALTDRFDRMREIERGVRLVYAPAAAPEDLIDSVARPGGPAGEGVAGRIGDRSGDRAADRAGDRASSGGLRRWVPYAALVAVVGVVWLLAGRVSSVPAEAPIDAAAAFQRMSTAMQPAVVCDTYEKFVAYTDTSFGVPIAASFASAAAGGIELVGWRGVGPGAYEEDRSPRAARALMARGPGGEPVITLFLGRDAPRPAALDEPGFTVFEGEVGGVRLFEMSALDGPVVLPLLSVE